MQLLRTYSDELSAYCIFPIHASTYSPPYYAFGNTKCQESATSLYTYMVLLPLYEWFVGVCVQVLIIFQTPNLELFNPQAVCLANCFHPSLSCVKSCFNKKLHLVTTFSIPPLLLGLPLDLSLQLLILWKPWVACACLSYSHVHPISAGDDHSAH